MRYILLVTTLANLGLILWSAYRMDQLGKTDNPKASLPSAPWVSRKRYEELQKKLAEAQQREALAMMRADRNDTIQAANGYVKDLRDGKNVKV